MSTARLRSPGPRARHRAEDRIRNSTRPPDPEPAPPLHAALDYRARRLCAALDDARARDAALAHFPPATAALLRWWCAAAVCRSRVDNFNPAQQRAILHVLLAHDLLGGDDPATLHRRACDPDAEAGPPPQARYRLRLAPGSGLRWVLQALLVWCWAGGEGGHALLRLLAAGPALQQRLRAAILGHALPGDAGEGLAPGTDPDRSSLMRHARLFLPPALRAPFRAWLATSAAAALQPMASDDSPPGEVQPGQALPGVFRLLAESADGSRRLQIDLLVATGPEVTAAGDSLLDLPPARAIRLGACKLPVLEAVAPVGADLRARPPARPGRRPRLSRMQQRLLAAAFAALRLREQAFAALDPVRRPRLRVLCASPQLLRAARSWLIAAGLDPRREIAIHAGAPVADGVRVVLDEVRHGPQTPHALAIADPRVCVVAVLRTHRGDPAMPPAKIAAAGAALLWPEPEFAELRAENGERAARGRAPRHRIDALSIFDDPACRDEYAGLPHARGDGDTTTIVDDLFLAPVREHADGLDLPLPGFGPPGSEETPAEAWLGALPQRVLRRRRAVAVTRSIHGHADCSAHDSGLRRAFLECAEADPAIECHGLPDPRRHRAPGREALLARCADGRGWPDALVRTARHLYLVEFLPSEPLHRTAPGAAERALLDWLRTANASAANRPGARTWRRVALPAPLFWSWKRRGMALSELLETLVTR